MLSDSGKVDCMDVSLDDPRPRNGKAWAERASKDRNRAIAFGASIIIKN